MITWEKRKYGEKETKSTHQKIYCDLVDDNCNQIYHHRLKKYYEAIMSIIQEHKQRYINLGIERDKSWADRAWGKQTCKQFEPKMETRLNILWGTGMTTANNMTFSKTGRNDRCTRRKGAFELCLLIASEILQYLRKRNSGIKKPKIKSKYVFRIKRRLNHTDWRHWTSDKEGWWPMGNGK